MMKTINRYKGKQYAVSVFGILTMLFVFLSVTQAQSNDQNFPTPIVSNQISGTIKARDLGDSRLTSYFYIFNGQQGDIFINVQTQNLNGDIDLFTLDGLKPLTKIAIYADASDNETGRVVYLRKAEKILLRIEGRTPNDDPATFAVKFAGSFTAVADSEVDQSSAPVVSSTANSDVQVNSVGTIIGIKPKPTPSPQTESKQIEKTETVAKNPLPQDEEKTDAVKPQKPNNKPRPNKKKSQTESQKDTENKNIAAENDSIPAIAAKPKKIKEKPSKKQSEEENETVSTENPIKNKAEKATETNSATKASETKKAAEKAESEALANIHLIILFKDGTKIERPMSEVLKVGVDKATLTVITKDGKIGRYSILEVAKFTIE